MCNPTFTLALVTIVKTWKLMSMGGWMCYVCVYTTEYYSAIKRRKYCYIDITDGSWGHDVR